jgi:hypothetical protein
MLIFEFQRCQTIIDEDKNLKPHLEDASVLKESYFIMPVRLNVSNQELLEMPSSLAERDKNKWVVDENRQIVFEGNEDYMSTSSPWLNLPLLNLATVGLEKIKETWENGESYYNLSEYGCGLILKRTDTYINILSQINQRRSSVQYNELLMAFKKFAFEVKGYLIQEVPELLTHGFWGNWLKQQDLLDQTFTDEVD